MATNEKQDALDALFGGSDIIALPAAKSRVIPCWNARLDLALNGFSLLGSWYLKWLIPFLLLHDCCQPNCSISARP